MTIRLRRRPEGQVAMANGNEPCIVDLPRVDTPVRHRMTSRLDGAGPWTTMGILIP